MKVLNCASTMYLMARSMPMHSQVLLLCRTQGVSEGLAKAAEVARQTAAQIKQQTAKVVIP